MIRCATCNTLYPHGTLICLNDGFQFERTPESARMLAMVASRVVILPGVRIVIEHVDGIHFADPRPVVEISQYRLAGPPIRIGRRDLSAHPPIQPEIDFQMFFEGRTDVPPVSRIHAAIEVIDGRVCLRSVSKFPTYYRPTKTSRPIPLMQDREYRELVHADSIYLCRPDGPHVRLRYLTA